MDCEQSTTATFLRNSQWGYAALNAAHISGIALLVGGILPLDLRLLGLWPSIARNELARVLVPTAAVGLAIAIVTGLLLLSVRASEYANLTVLWVKLGLILFGATSAISVHVRYGLWFERAGSANLALAGAASAITWIGALAAGRAIAFVQ